MNPDQTPFPSGWWGQALGNVRTRLSTYGRYQHEDLPSLPFDLHGDFAWLSRQPGHDRNVSQEKPAENDAALSALLADAAKRALELPPEFIAFFRSPDLQRRIRSCTECFLDLSPALVPSPIADGFMARFLADSQGCIFWYLYQRAGHPDHCIVASPDFYGAAAEQWEREPPDPSQIIFCERSFEAFICRFWLENEIWYWGEKRPLFTEGQHYLDNYGRSA